MFLGRHQRVDNVKYHYCISKKLAEQLEKIKKTLKFMFGEIINLMGLMEEDCELKATIKHEPED